MTHEQTTSGVWYTALGHTFYEGSKQFKIYPEKESRLRKDLETPRYNEERKKVGITSLKK